METGKTSRAMIQLMTAAMMMTSIAATSVELVGQDVRIDPREALGIRVSVEMLRNTSGSSPACACG
jgi:hypothetical protein